MNKVRLHTCMMVGLLLVAVPLTGCSDSDLGGLNLSIGGAEGLSFLGSQSSPNGADEVITAENLERWRPLAEQGDVSAQYILGKAYSVGGEVPQDYTEAARWYRLAAEQEHVVAQTELGLLYSRGHGVPQDYIQAHMWLTLAVAQGDEDAVQHRDALAEEMTPLQVAKAEHQAREWSHN